MSLIRWNQTRDLPTFPSDIMSMQREINRMFDGLFRTSWQGDELSGAWAPAVDIAEKADSYAVNVELPGVAKEDVKITMHDNVLTIRGEKKQEQESREANYQRVERTYGSFSRSFTLPTGVKAGDVEATYKDGILNILLPKAEEAKPKQIEVKVK
jgi:HSP20 family protein